MINIQVDFNPKLLIKKDFFLLAITNEFKLFIVNFIYCYYIWS
jgi:translation initiation factor 2 beta subunit (eIF-2beta)/eIF-5